MKRVMLLIIIVGMLVGCSKGQEPTVTSTNKQAQTMTPQNNEKESVLTTTQQTDAPTAETTTTPIFEDTTKPVSSETAPTETTQLTEAEPTEDNTLIVSWTSVDDWETISTVYEMRYENGVLTGHRETTVLDPERIDGPAKEPFGEFTMSDSFFAEPTAKLIAMLLEDQDNYELKDTLGLLCDLFELDVTADKDMSTIEGMGWFYDLFGGVADFNHDDKIVMREYFSYLIKKADPTYTLQIETNEKPLDTDAWTAKQLVPIAGDYVSPRFELLDMQGTQITLAGNTYNLTSLTLKDLLDGGMVGELDLERNSGQTWFCYFPDYPDATFMLLYRIKDKEGEHIPENYEIDTIDVRFPLGSEHAFYYGFGDLVIDANAKKQAVFDYFDLRTGGINTVYLLYAERGTIKLQLGSILTDGSEQYSNSLQVQIIKTIQR